MATECIYLRSLVTDLINQLVQVLRRELAQLRESVQELEELEPVEPWDEG